MDGELQSVVSGFATQESTVVGSEEPGTAVLVDRRSDFVEAEPGKSEAGSQLSKAPVRSGASRWANGRRCAGRTSRTQDKDELKKQRKMRVEKFDDFVEWVDGDASLKYHPKDSDARKHLSGWAMRNTNNHNKKVLKKSCLGVYVCNRSCRGASGDIVTIRPATSDRARRKQADKKCPRPGCDGKLYHVACSGKNGYPVTHFWRVTDTVIIFQSKGRHDHPRPDVVKTPSVAKMALFEYHRTHKHERPKDICKRMGVHIHKSFSRVDRVARQLREVQTALSKDEKGTEKKDERIAPRHHGYSLRNSLTRMWGTHGQTLGAVEAHQQARTGVTIPAGGIRQHSLSSNYQDQAQYDAWGCSYVPQQHTLQADYQHGYMTGYPAQLPSEYYHNSMYAAGYQLSSSGPLVYDPSSMNYEGYDATLPPKSDVSGQVHRMTELTVVRESTGEMTTSPPGAAPRFSPLKYSPVTPNGHDQSYFDSPMISPLGRSTLKRSLPPALHHIDSKHPRLDQSSVLEHSAPLKLADQTPPINIDMSSFSDIFDISASLGEEGLAGRPKTPVFHAPSPPVHDSPQKPTGAALQSCYPPVSPSSSIEAAASPQTALSVSVASSPSTVQDPTETTLTSPSTFKYHQLIHHSPGGPVLTQLSTHSHQASSTATEDENGTYIDFLVSMYLKDSEKPISTLKNELHVYTERNNQKSLAFRAEQGLQFTPHLKSPTSSQFDFSWYDMDRRSQHFRNPSSSQTNLISPLNSTGQFDYSAPYLKDVFPIDQVSDPSRVLFLRNMNTPGNPVSLNRHIY